MGRRTMSALVFALTLLAALACGLMAGAFFAFSAFVMKALARLAPVQGITAMQSINASAISVAFMVALFGTAAACTALAVSSLTMWDEPFAILLLAGGLLYLVGTILLTITRHVPLNEALAAVPPDSAGAPRHWSRYVATWTAWNHVRGIAALAAATVLTIALTIS